MAKFKNQKGLTLIELLITISVLAVVSAIALPVINNVVTSSNSNALNQTIEDAEAFIAKYSKSGVVMYDELTRTFTGYVDSDGDNTIDYNEKIDSLTLDDKYAVSATGSAQVGGQYTNGGVTGATITGGGSSQPATQGVTFGSAMWNGGPAAGFNNGWIVFSHATASDGGVVEYAIEVSTDGGNTWVLQTSLSSMDGSHVFQNAWFPEPATNVPGIYTSNNAWAAMDNGSGYVVIGVPNLYQGNVGTKIRILARSSNDRSTVVTGPSVTTEW